MLQYVAEVIIGAPYTVTDGMMEQCRVSACVVGDKGWRNMTFAPSSV